MISVSVICCCRNEIRTIRSFLKTLETQRELVPNLEAVIADGESSDGTWEVLDEFAKDRRWVRLLVNAARIASTGLNAAIGATSGVVIIRLDAHTVYASDYIAECLSTLERTDASAVGGPVRAAPGTWFQNAVALAWSSPFFSGKSTVYDRVREGSVDSVPYGCWPREVILRAGCFDEKMGKNQDDELSFRIIRGGGLIWQSPSIRSFYHPRRSLAALARQFFGYGFWKVYTMRKHRTVVSLRHIVPAASVLAIAALLVTSPTALVVSAALYGLVVFASVASLMQTLAQVRLIPALLVIFPTAHLAYGVGTLAGLIHFRTSQIGASLPQKVQA